MKKKIEYPKLPKRFKEKWLIALRSGEYQQVKENLYLCDKYCCLGVACNVMGVSDKAINGWGTPTRALSHKIPKYFYEAPWLEVLMEMNDTEEKSFKQIALWIERNL